MYHQHFTCEHRDVRYCKECQKIYCAVCGREWFDKCILNHYPVIQPATPYPYYPVTWTYDDNLTHIH
jgi:hypothetical protein